MALTTSTSARVLERDVPARKTMRILHDGYSIDARQHNRIADNVRSSSAR